MTSKHNFLYLEDHEEDVELLVETLKREYIPGDVSWVNGREAFESALTGGWGYDLILADYHLPDLNGEEALAIAKQRCPNVPFIFVSGSLGEERAVECLRHGATDYVLKSHLARLGPVVRRALKEAREAAARREAENATSRAVSLLRATLESTSEGILVVDLAGRISTYNRKFMSLCGIPDFVMAPMEMDRVLQFLLDQFQDPEAFLSEARLLTGSPDREHSGRIHLQDHRVLEGAVRPNGMGSQSLGRVFSFRDVTAHEHATDRLEALANSSQTLLDAAGAVGVASWRLTPDALLLAPVADTILGLPSGSRPKDLPELEAFIHPEELDRFRRALEHPGGEACELRLRKGDGWIWTRWLVEREPHGYQGIFLDVTRQRLREEADAERRQALRTAYLADHTAQAIRKLLRQIQEPLNQRRVKGGLDADQDRTARNLATIDALLDQATLSVRCDPETGQPLELPPLLEAFGVMAGAKLAPGIELKVQLDPNLPRLPMHPSHLLQVLLNLFYNAREAVHGSGTITYRVGPLPSGGIFLEVEDDGAGIPPAVLSRMFEPFFTTRTDADGLGLAVVRSIVEAYHGSLEVSSAAGQGTTLRVLLPEHGTPRQA